MQRHYIAVGRSPRVTGWDGRRRPLMELIIPHLSMEIKYRRNKAYREVRGLQPARDYDSKIPAARSQNRLVGRSPRSRITRKVEELGLCFGLEE